MTISVKDLSKSFPRFDRPIDRLRQVLLSRQAETESFWALRDIAFELPQGGALGIVGKNGSGKSTLLQLLCGVMRPTTGRIAINGRIAALLELGSGFNPDFTGRENVYLNASLLGMSRADIDASFAEIAAFAEIGEFIDLPIKTYSSGMLVRLAFSVQVQIEPDILIVDEALAVGDVLFQKRCFQRIESLRSRGTSLLFVSHDEESVRTLTDRAILLRSGRIAAEGAPSDVLLEYRRQLHDDERSYFEHRIHLSSDRSGAARERPPVEPTPAPSDSAERSASLSFGDLDAEVAEVRVLDAAGAPATFFYPEDAVRVEVDCIAHRPLDHLNVALRLRNKEGIKLYSWGTLNQDMAILAGRADDKVFWRRSFERGQRFTVTFEWVCGLGANLYEIQAAITREGKPYYSEQRMLHWRDEAGFFHVAMRQREYHFGGVADLRMRAHCD